MDEKILILDHDVQSIIALTDLCNLLGVNSDKLNHCLSHNEVKSILKSVTLLIIDYDSISFNHLKILQESLSPKQKIIVLTAFIDPKMYQKLKELDIWKIYPKPLSIVDLGKVLMDFNFISELPPNYD